MSSSGCKTLDLDGGRAEPTQVCRHKLAAQVDHHHTALQAEQITSQIGDLLSAFLSARVADLIEVIEKQQHRLVFAVAIGDQILNQLAQKVSVDRPFVGLLHSTSLARRALPAKLKPDCVLKPMRGVDAELYRAGPRLSFLDRHLGCRRQTQEKLGALSQVFMERVIQSLTRQLSGQLAQEPLRL